MLAFPSVRQGLAQALAAAVILLAVLGYSLAAGEPVGAQASVEWDTYDVSIDVRPDGSIHVVEEQWVNFGGAFSTGFADIPLNRIEEISNLSVFIGDGPGSAAQAEFVPPSDYDAEPGTYTYRSSSSALNLDYAFERTSSGDSRYIRLEYDAFGALRVYPDLEPANQQLWWTAIASEVTEIAPVNSSTVTVTLPEEVPPEQLVAAPENFEADGATYTWQRASLGSGEEFEVRLQFPMITAATVPSWLQLDDQIREEQQEQEERSAVAGTLFFAAGLIVLVIGGIGFSLAWFTKGRDPHVGLVAEYIAQPPDDLSPGAAGALVDEHVEVHDVLATVLDLANRGVLKINEAGRDEGTFGVGASYNHEFELIDPEKTRRPYEDALLGTIFGLSREPGAKVSMSTFRQHYTSRADFVAAGYYDELVEQGYFTERPQKTRARWASVAIVLTVVVVAAAVIVQNYTDFTSGWVVFPIFAAIVVGLVGFRFATRMPAKTREGAEASAKWKAFRKYLDDIDQREDLAEAKDIFDKYLPYAVAFGLERSFVRKFSAAETPMPEWFGGGWSTGSPGHRPMRRSRRVGAPWVIGLPGQSYPGQGSGHGGTGGMGGSGGDFGGMPDLQEMSDFGGRSLQGGSDSFFDMLNTASKAFTSTSRSGSFGSFGGSGGFSGGGGFGGGGSSGGGGRGFG